MECSDEKREGTATELASTNGSDLPGGTATEHASTNGSDLPGGTATGHASGTCTDLGLVTDVEMASGGDRKTYPILEVAFPNDMWWSVPSWLSQDIYAQYALGNDVGYTWDWGDKRNGSYVNPEGYTTTINRYTIDFTAMLQTNIDNNRKRSVRWIWICEDDVAPAWSGQIKRSKTDACR